MTVRQLLETMDAHELAEWMAYDKLEPFGEVRADIRAAIIAHTIASVWTKHPPELEAFLPFVEKPTQTFAEMKSVLSKAKHTAFPMIERAK